MESHCSTDYLGAIWSLAFVSKALYLKRSNTLLSNLQGLLTEHYTRREYDVE